MEYRKLGKSELEVPSVIFGAWAIGGWFWGGSDDEEAVRALQASIDLGMNCIDTAPMYGCGRSEEVVGRAIRGRRDRVIIATKCGLRWDRTDGQYFFESRIGDGEMFRVHRVLKKDSILEECEASLRRLGIETIELYQCHWPDKTTPLEETMEAMNTLLDQGKIRSIGVSNFAPEMLEKCLRLAPLASDQPKYNLLERGIEKDILPFCLEKHLGLIVYSPIAQGLLTGKVTMDRTFPEDDFRQNQAWFKPRNRKRVLDALEKVKPIAADHGMTLAQLAIQWTVSEPGVTSAIVGARNPKQAEENARAADFRLSREERSTIRGVFENLGDPER